MNQSRLKPTRRQKPAPSHLRRGRGPLRVVVKATADGELPFTGESIAFPGAQAGGVTPQEAAANTQELALAVLGERSLGLLSEWVALARAHGLGSEGLVARTEALLLGKPSLRPGKIWR